LHSAFLKASLPQPQPFGREKDGRREEGGDDRSSAVRGLSSDGEF